MSSSSESDDENLKLFCESVDTTVFSDQLYGKSENDDGKSDKKSEKTESKSQRYLDVEEEKSLKSDLVVSEHMQQFIYKKLSKIIDDQVEFVTEKSKKKKKAENDEIIDNLRLLSDSEESVKFYQAPEFTENRQKVDVKRRKVFEEPDDCHKIKESAVTSTFIESEPKTWTAKVKHPPVDYKLIKGVAYIRDQPNEFTKQRNKNSWSESKIKNAKYFNKSLESRAKNGQI